MFIIHYKIGILKLPATAKVMANQNFKCVYLGNMILCLQTNLLKNEAEYN